jgi:flagellar hook-basal body complex protein FliE
MNEHVSFDGLIGQMQSLAAQARNQPQAASGQGEAVDFSALLGSAIKKINSLQQHAAQLQESFERGEADISLAEVMIASQKASIGFQTLAQVRNKLIRAYQDVMNMPI